MRYLGGKAKIAKKLAAAVRANTDTVKLWEPFCGGMNATKALVDVGFEVHASDAHPALVALFDGWRRGWRPPAKEALSKDGHAAAKTLPDADPLKAFYGFGLSFGGLWFGGFTGVEGFTPPTPTHPRGMRQHYYAAACSAIDTDARSAASVFRASFFDVPPEPSPGWAIYCDPPYADTTGYATGAFDHEAFWRRCYEWSLVGVDVFVSEYSAPSWVPALCSFAKRVTASAQGNGRVATDNLYLLKGRR